MPKMPKKKPGLFLQFNFLTLKLQVVETTPAEATAEEPAKEEAAKEEASPPADETGSKRAIEEGAEEPAQKKQTPDKVKEKKVTKEPATAGTRTTRVTKEVC